MRNTCLATLGALFLFACGPSETSTATTDTASTVTTTTNATTDTGAAPAVTPIDFKLDHYKIWRVKPVPAKGTVYLKGQFDDKEWRADLVSLQLLGNPTRKTITADGVKVEIKNEALHYDVYAIETAQQPPRDVWVTNQFAKEELWKLTQPRWLLVPAAKRVITQDKKAADDLEEPAAADHFVCYAAPRPRMPRAILLQDQFDRLKGPEDQEQIGELEPLAFCVPVEKRFRDKTYPINDKETHLALYKINPPEQYPISVWTKDQFGSRQLDVTNSELLGVPSLKKYEPKTPAKTAS